MCFYLHNKYSLVFVVTQIIFLGRTAWFSKSLQVEGFARSLVLQD